MPNRMARRHGEAGRHTFQAGVDDEGKPLDWTIRKLAADEMLSLEFIPAEVARGQITDPEAVKAATFGPDLSSRVNRVIVAAMVEPRIWIGTPETCPENEAWIGDLGAVRDRIVTEIYDFSKLKEDLEQAARFRDPQGAGAPVLDAGANGGGAAVGPAATEVAP